MSAAAETQEQQRMHEAFSLVSPDRFDAALSWRDRIDAVVTDAELRDAGIAIEEVLASVMFMTATAATAQQLLARPLVWRITARGYRLGPAGDH